MAPELPWSRPGARARRDGRDDLVFWEDLRDGGGAHPGAAPSRPGEGAKLAPLAARGGHRRGAAALWPRLSPDIVVRRADGSAPLVIDTKFTSMTERHYALERFKTAHLYQMLAYLATDPEMAGGRAEGLLLYPRIGGEPAEEAATVRGYRMRLATVDLAAEPRTIVDRIVGLAEGESRGAAAGRNAGFSAGGGAFARMADCEPV